MTRDRLKHSIGVACAIVGLLTVDDVGKRIK